MNMNQFLHLPLREYGETLRRGGGTWLFQHIPKTAGTSLVQELRFCLPPYRNIHVSAEDSEAMSHHDALMNAVERFLRDDAQFRFHSASGHLRQSHLDRIRSSMPEIRLFTWLRDPVERVVSEYRYTRTPKHPTYKDYLERYTCVEEFVDDSNEQDKMWRFIAPRALKADSEGLCQLFERFTFIGILEEMDLCFRFFTGLSGCPKPPTARTNITRSDETNSVEISPELKDRIRAANPRDMALYGSITKALSQRRADMEAEIAARRAFFAMD